MPNFYIMSVMLNTEPLTNNLRRIYPVAVQKYKRAYNLEASIGEADLLTFGELITWHWVEGKETLCRVKSHEARKRKIARRVK